MTEDVFGRAGSNCPKTMCMEKKRRRRRRRN